MRAKRPALVQTIQQEDTSVMQPMELEGKVYTDRKDAGYTLLEICKARQNTEAVPIGSYRKFPMSLFYDAREKEFVLLLQGKKNYSVELGADPLGNIQRINNTLERLPQNVPGMQQYLEEAREELRIAKEEAEKPFPQEQEFQEKSARLQELNALLNMDEKDAVILDDAAEEEEMETVRAEPCAVR